MNSGIKHLSGTSIAAVLYGHSRLYQEYLRGAEGPANVQNPYQTNLMLAGYDEKVGPSLYLIDYLGSMHSMNMAGTGYGKWNRVF